jgi:hypothetical protein
MKDEEDNKGTYRCRYKHEFLPFKTPLLLTVKDINEDFSMFKSPD